MEPKRTREELEEILATPFMDLEVYGLIQKELNELNNLEAGWICTDPDEDQWGRELDHTMFEFKTKDSSPRIIDLTEYNENEILIIVSSYGYGNTIKEIKGWLGSVYSWIVAECIYETEFTEY